MCVCPHLLHIEHQNTLLLAKWRRVWEVDHFARRRNFKGVFEVLRLRLELGLVRVVAVVHVMSDITFFMACVSAMGV